MNLHESTSSVTQAMRLLLFMPVQICVNHVLIIEHATCAINVRDTQIQKNFLFIAYKYGSAE